MSYSSTASGPSSSTSIDLDKCDDIGLLLEVFILGGQIIDQKRKRDGGEGEERG